MTVLRRALRSLISRYTYKSRLGTLSKSLHLKSRPTDALSRNHCVVA